MFPVAVNIAVLLVAVGASGPTSESQKGVADVLLTGGTIHLDVDSTTQVLAIQGGAVIAVGGEAEKLRVPTTKTVDLKGAHVFSGFHDNHTHILPGSFAATQLNLAGADTMDKILEALRNYLISNPGTSWVNGFGWRLGPDEHSSGIALDEFTGDRPTVLTDASGHSALVNSAALRRAGISAQTPDIQGGEIMRDPETGEPTGLLKELAMSLVFDVMMPEITDRRVGAGLENILQLFAANGLTSISDILGIPGVEMARPWLFTQLEKEGKLPLRVHYFIPIFSPADVEQAASLGERFDTELVRFSGGKIWVDGAMGSADAWVSFPRNDEIFLDMGISDPLELEG